MYPVSQYFQDIIKKDGNNRIFDLKIQIQHSKGVLDITDRELVQGTLVYTESSQAGEEFTIGSAVASDIKFTILNKSEYEDIQFIGATVTCNIGLLVKEGAEAHFMQPSQPSKMLGFDEKWEYVPLGRFDIDYVNKQRNTIQLKAIDNMISLDKPYSLSKLVYPATLYQIYVNICNVADIPVGTTKFPNQNYVVNTRPDNELTLRDVLGYVAELSGCFARCNRNGAMELLWYKPTGLELGSANRFDFKPSDDEVRIKGIMATVNDTIYLAGSDEYAVDLTENPLLQGNYETVLRNIYDNVKDTVFIPYTSGWQGNPALQAGDMITQIDRDGKVYKTLVTKSIYKYRGRSVLEAKGLPEISQGYQGSTNRKIAQIKRKIEIEVGDRLTTMEEQILASTELIANMLGGYAIQGEDAFYIADNKDLSKAVKVWKWGLGGFGYSENGINGPYTTAVTADGSIVAMLVAANIITANMVQTGILQSEDGGTTLNLDDGSFNFRNLLRLDNSGVKLFIGDKNTGNYVALSPDEPFRVYINNKTMAELDALSDIGGYLYLNRSNGEMGLRLQARGTENEYDIIAGNNDGKINIWGNEIHFISSRDSQVRFDGHGYFGGDLTVRGDKSAIVRTEHYGDRRLYAEESGRSYFSDKGVSRTVNGKCIIRLDDVFYETIEPNSVYPYAIKLTPYADTRVFVKDVFDKYIIICSHEDCKFSYDISCIRKGYKNVYLEERSIRAFKLNSKE